VAVVNKAILELNLPITNPFKQLEIVDEGHDKDERKPFSPEDHVTIAEACMMITRPGPELAQGLLFWALVP